MVTLDIRRRRMLVLAAVATVALAGCREAEQNRPLSFEPGVYKGERTAPLTKEQQRELKDRGNLMR